MYDSSNVEVIFTFFALKVLFGIILERKLNVLKSGDEQELHACMSELSIL